MTEEITTLIERITLLENRVIELERCKHDSHAIVDEAVQQIVNVVKTDISQELRGAGVRI